MVEKKKDPAIFRTQRREGGERGKGRRPKEGLRPPTNKMFKDQGKRGENAELQEELASNDKDKKRDAVKKVIRDMTLGKDVSGLFSAVVNNMMTPNLEVRKLVYLYLINYAKTQPELAIMAVNGFVKDARWPGPACLHPLPSPNARASARCLCPRICQRQSRVESRLTHAPVQRSESAHPGLGCTNYGLYPRPIHQRVSLRVFAVCGPSSAPCTLFVCVAC